MNKEILPFCVISLLIRCEQSIQRTGLTIKEEMRSLHLCCGFWPGKTVVLHPGRNAYCRFLGQSGRVGVAILMTVHRLPPGTLPCGAHHIWDAVWVQVCSTPVFSLSTPLQCCLLVCIYLLLEKVTNVI